MGRPRTGGVHVLDDDGEQLPADVPGTIYPGGGGAFQYHDDPDTTADWRDPRENVLVVPPKVVDVAVMGVPDDDLGEQVTAVVQPAVGLTDHEALERELIAHCRAHLAGFTGWCSVDAEAEQPRLPTGELDQRALRDRYRGRSATSVDEAFDLADAAVALAIGRLGEVGGP